MTKLSEPTKGDDQAFIKYMTMFEILCVKRNLKTEAKEALEILSDAQIEQLPSYKLGFERGFKLGFEKSKLESKLKSAYIMLDFGIKPQDVAEKLKIPLEQLLARK